MTKTAPRQKRPQDENGPKAKTAPGRKRRWLLLLYNNYADFKKQSYGCAQVFTQAQTCI